MSKEFSIVVCGSPRVGKSTLVNALCETQAIPTSAGLNSHTDRIQKYVLKRTNLNENDSSDYLITIHDTPGIESWTEENVRVYFTNLMKESEPLCLIYCASPGSFARLDHLQWLIDTCIQSNIFCALVRTNRYSGHSQQRKQILDDFHSLLAPYHHLSREEGNIKYYGDVALCASVNSIVLDDPENSMYKPVEGINELVFGILKSLNSEKAVGWIYTIAENESFWSTMIEQIGRYYDISKPVLQQLVRDHGKDMTKTLIRIVVETLLKK